MLWKTTQHSWVGGRLDEELSGRQDLSKYFQGASELKNFLVRRQGNLSKRRGTDLACDLRWLLGGVDATDGSGAYVRVPNAIDKARLFPVVYERDRGFYLLMTAKRAFVLSADGIRLMDGTWTREVADYTLSDYAKESVASDKRPYYVSVPYEDAILAEVDVKQSGDTLFAVHRTCPPAKLVFSPDSCTFEYEALDFSAYKWARPAIKSAEGTGFEGTGGTRTIYYVCTYVKDGVESQPSLPYAFTYNLPWPEGARVQLTFDRGDNATPPDYYNVYKKDSVEYGLISTFSADAQVSAYPTLSATVLGGTASGFMNRDPEKLLSYEGNYREYVGYEPPMSNKLNIRECVATVTGIGGWSGTSKGAGATLSFGENSNTVVTKVTVALDAVIGRSNRHIYWWYRVKGNRHTGGSAYYQWTCDYYKTGTYFKGILHLRTESLVSGGYKSGNSYYLDLEQYSATSDPNDYALGHTLVDESTGKTLYSEKMVVIANGKRSVTFDYLSDIKEKFGATVTSGYPFQVVSFKVVAYDNSTSKNTVMLYANNVRFSNAYGVAEQVTDDYITPDLTTTPPASESHFQGVTQYPGAVGIYQQRLAFASTAENPYTFWLSCVGNLYDFNTHPSIREDDAIEATLAATEFPQINHIVMNRDLMLFCDSGEWEVSPVSGNTLSYKTISAKLQSVIGCSKTVKPLVVGDEILFAKQTGETLVATRYNWASDGYESTDLSVLSQWVFRNNPIVQMAYRQHPDSTVECVLTDGTVATLVYMKEHEVCAWSRQELGGGWKARGVATSKAISRSSTETMLLVERDGDYALWRVRDDVASRGEDTVADQVAMDAVREVTPLVGGAVVTVPAGMTAVSHLDGSVVAAGAPLTAGLTYSVGYVYESKLVTIRPEATARDTPLQFEIKNATEIEARVIDGSAFVIRPYGAEDRYARRAGTDPKCADGDLALVDVDARVTLYGVNTRDGRIELTHASPWPLNVLSLGVTYSVELANQESGGEK